MTTIMTLPEPSPVFEGIYAVPEVARYLKAANHGGTVYAVSSGKLRRWIRRGFASPNLVGLAGAELLIAFEDVISMRVIATLRAAATKGDRSQTTVRHRIPVGRPGTNIH